MTTKHTKEELRTNELAEAVTHPGDWWNLHAKPWWDKYGTYVLLVVLVAVASFTGMCYWRQYEHRRLEAAYTELADAGSPNVKLSVAESYEGKIPGFGSKARLDAADLLLREVLLGEATLGATKLTDDQKKKNLEQAAKLYAQVIERNETPLLVLYARRGAAAVAESQGDFAAARKQYEAIEKDATGEYAGIGEQAKARAADLDRIAKPVVFAAPPPPKKAIDMPGNIPGLPGGALNLPGVNQPLGPEAPSAPGVNVPNPTAPTPAPGSGSAPAPASTPAPAPAPAK
jgi:hypothetical protein